MKKKKTVMEKWCPLTGDIGPDENIIRRAREFWGVRTIVRENVAHIYVPSKETIEKARAIYDRWHELQRDPLNLERMEAYIGLALNTEVPSRKRYLEDVISWFWDLRAQGFEVFTILAIYESRIAKNPVWPIELLAFSEKFSPDAMMSKKVSNGARQGGRARALQAHKEGEKTKKDLQARAEKKWRERPSLGKKSIAELIHKDLLKENNKLPPEERKKSYTVGTIRQYIKKYIS